MLKRSLRLLQLTLGLLFVAQLNITHALADDAPYYISQKPKLDAALGIWIGWAEGTDDLFLYRLELAVDSGSFAQDYVGNVSVLPILKCSMTNYDLTLVFKTNSIGIQQVTGEIVTPVIRCTVFGDGWQHRVTLHREARFEQRWKELKRQMRHFRPTVNAPNLTN